MDSEDSDKVPSGESEEVIKDSTIKVTVDDLQPGIIVVSFSHKKTLYQGVLLQLDRNRGIPCGISFPKSFIQDSQKAEEIVPKEIIAVELSPLNKRQTYFQRDLLNDPTIAIVDPHSKFPTLRRNIKPPARYKNSRMNLRVRNRPVLCAKCQTLCEDKGPPPSNENGDDDPAKKILAGVSTRRNQGKSSKGDDIFSIGSTSLVDTASAKLSDDYNYSSYGQRGVVNNYWRRPNGMEVLKVDDKLRYGGTASSSKSLLNHEPKIYIKPISTMNLSKRELPSTKILGVPKLGQSSTSDGNVPVWPLIPILPPTNDSNLSSNAKKSKNLKLCISKLTMSKCDKTEPKICLSKETERVTRSTAALIQDNEFEPFNLKMKDCHKSWNSRIRKRSSVPARFRDESYLTKNIFKFKRRRVDEKPGVGGMQPIYTSRLVSSDNDELSNDCSEVVENREGIKNESASHSDTSGNSSLSSSSSVTSLSASNGDGKIEPAKTPVIKITFGSSGNGIVVQIPPKTTQEESNSSPDSKAARKAMKKAKKEARRKVSVSREPSPSPKITFSPQSTQDNFPDSPLPPILNPEYPITPLNDESESLLCDRGPPPVEPMEPLHYIPKRRKKEKKKKRSKVSKENDLNTTHASSVQDSQRQLNNQESVGQIRYCRNADTLAVPQMILEDEGNLECTKTVDNGTDNSSHANHTEAHQRLCLSLKRLDENMYCKIACASTFVNNNDERENSDSSNISEVLIEPYEYPSNGYQEGTAESLDFYFFEETDHTFRKGDIIWGKLPECPWWPGKIQDILYTDVDDVRAKVTWYKSDVSSYIQFESITPFAGTFDAMYTKQRNRGEYQEAVRHALLEAHEMSPKHISSE